MDLRLRALASEKLSEAETIESLGQKYLSFSILAHHF